LLQALDTLRRNPPSGSFRVPLWRMVQKLEGGSSFSEAIRSVHGWLPTFDAALLEAGERSGRLPQSFRQLAQYYTERCLVARQVCRTWPTRFFCSISRFSSALSQIFF